MTEQHGSECLYYLDQFADEILPCEPKLSSWAEWLSKPDLDWGRDRPADDGETFMASILRFEADVIARPTPTGWQFSREPDGADFFAVRYGPGLGWDGESICGDMAAVRDVLAQYGDAGEEYVAVAFNEPPITLMYRANPPRLEKVVAQ